MIYTIAEPTESQWGLYVVADSDGVSISTGDKRDDCSHESIEIERENIPALIDVLQKIHNETTEAT